MRAASEGRLERNARRPHHRAYAPAGRPDRSAERFYRDVLGFDVTCRYPGGSFFGAGGDHHQVAANTWNSLGAGPCPNQMTGLDGFDLVIKVLPMNGNRTTLRHPWGVAITLVTD